MPRNLKRNKKDSTGKKILKSFSLKQKLDPELKNFLQNQAGILGLKPAKGKIADIMV
jgi:hypothetical protein